MEQQHLLSELPIVCTLTAEERERRGDTLSALLGVASRVDEIPDGYAFHFDGTEEWARRLVDLVVFERRCCRFFTFELHFAPNDGPIQLCVRGPDGVKALLGDSALTQPSF